MLIPAGNDPVMQALAEDALRGVDKRLYGCGPMDHANLIDLMRMPVDAIVGLCVTEEAVNASPDIRAQLAKFYRGVPIYVDDPLSIEWMLHYQRDDGRLGTNPAWAASQQAIDHLWKLRRDTSEFVTTVGEAILAALQGEEMILHPQGSGQTAFVDGVPFGHHPLVRFAARYDLPVGEPCKMPQETVVKARKEASELIQCLAHGQTASVTVDERVDKALGLRHTAPKKPGVRRLELGSVFDPATHYTAEYYNGQGIEYMRHDGQWTMYHGTALHWEGFKWVAKTLSDLLTPAPQRERLLDVGCSAGAFVDAMLDKGWDAYGIDLSDEARRYATQTAQPRLLVGDVCDPQSFKDRFDMVTSWDLLEHIYVGDVEALLQGIYDVLRPGGRFINTICTRGDGEHDFVARPGTVVTRENSWALVSGHVNIRYWDWWAQLLLSHGFELDYDLMYKFQVARSSDPVFCQTASWSPRNTLFARKPGEQRRKIRRERAAKLLQTASTPGKGFTF
jgi:SAM-dependent methyltransferase